MKTKLSLTKQQYQILDEAYAFFNSKLFDNQLPEVLIILNRKSPKTFGHFHAEQYITRQEASSKKKNKMLISELSLNPDKFLDHPEIEIMQTLGHEMVHAWQRHCTDKQPRGGYHDKIWGRKMEEIGLMPSHTGKPDGKKTGQQMMDYIIAGGKFEKIAKRFMQSHPSILGSLPQLAASKQSNKNKVKYSCPSCEANIWGKPGLHVECVDCSESFMEI